MNPSTPSTPAAVPKAARQSSPPEPSQLLREGLRTLAQGRAVPPQDGDIWRMDFSRFEALHANGRLIDPSIGWSFNKHGVYDSHLPECFTYVHFSHEGV